VRKLPVPSIVQIVGAVAITVGVALIFIPAGVITGGVFALLMGIATERTDKE
jgi:uncharacterized membrane-anchored protein YitT (DUF2179 family)